MSEQRGNRRGVVAGAVLILLGLVFLADQLVGGFGDSAILFLIGGAFIAGYFFYRNYGLLIPGCILVGLAFGSVGEDTAFGIGDFSSVGLGLGFIAIYLIDLAYSGETHWWPLIPGAILVVTGLAQDNEAIENLFRVGWPLILVLIGLLILAGAFGLTGRRGRDDAEMR
jgi:hypothetical protein